MKKARDFMEIYNKICAAREAEIAEYSENVIEVLEERRWDYGIPENYTNYRDGFLWQDEEPYRGMPMVNYKGKMLYLHRPCSFVELRFDESEKLMLFDRHGNKYLFIVKKAGVPLESNPSYFDFLKKVKQYDPEKKKTVAPGTLWEV